MMEPRREPLLARAGAACFKPGCAHRSVDTEAVSLAAVAAVAMTTPFRDRGPRIPAMCWHRVCRGERLTTGRSRRRITAAGRSGSSTAPRRWMVLRSGSRHRWRGPWFFDDARQRSHDVLASVLPFSAPVSIPAGGSVALNIAAHFVGGDYVWAWTARVCSTNGSESSVITQNSVAERVLDPAAFGMAL